MILLDYNTNELNGSKDIFFEQINVIQITSGKLGIFTIKRDTQVNNILKESHLYAIFEPPLRKNRATSPLSRATLSI